MSTSNEVVIAPNSGSGPETNSMLQSNGQAGEQDSYLSTINSNQGQQALCDDGRSSATGDEEPVAGTSGNFLIANASLASCNTILEDYCSSWISKAIALCRIYTTLLEVVFAGPVRWTGKKTEIELNQTAKDRTTGCGCTNSEFFRLPVATIVKKSKNRRKPV